MKGLFCFDGPMYRDINGIYCNVTLTNEVFDRYLKIVDHLTVAIRTFNLDIDYREANLHKIELDRITFVDLPNLNTFAGLIESTKNVKEIANRLVLETDLIFARMPSIISNLFIKSAQKNNKKYLVEVGGCVWDAYWNHSIKGKLLAPLLYVQTRKYISKADFAVYVTEEFLQRRYPNKRRTEVCSNVILAEGTDEILKKRFNKIVNRDPKSPIIIGTTAAVNVRYKGQEYIIKAISKLNNEGYNFEYELIGAGDKDYLQTLAIKYGVADKVHFLGVKLHNDVIKWLDNIDIYAQPSKQEGLPRALVEAMSRGCPAIGSKTAGIPELLNEIVLFKKGKVNEIIVILKNLNDGNMTALAESNYLKSREFESNIIEERRNLIFHEYYSDVDGIEC